jgi:hypothetical protein
MEGESGRERLPRGIVPEQLEMVRNRAMRAISPIKPTDNNTQADSHFLFNAERTEAGRDLPPYYLVYFLLVELLGFRNLGRFEKIAWSVPIDLHGTGYLIEHRKFGVGVFAHNAAKEEPQARQIVRLIKKGVKAAEPFFKWMAERAICESKLNVKNNSRDLFERYSYLAQQFSAIGAEAEERKDESHVEHREVNGGILNICRWPSYQLSRNASWMALATIDAFFSWTEHIFIHVAILGGRITTATEVAQLAKADWQSKFKAALDVSDPATKSYYDELAVIRRQLRNFITHGAFGKEGEAFDFHSNAGAVPVVLDNRPRRDRFSLIKELGFDNAKAIATINDFIAHLWSGPREPARIYLQESGLPLILTMATDGTYAKAMHSIHEMKEFVRYLSTEFDDAANMDW